MRASLFALAKSIYYSCKLCFQFYHIIFLAICTTKLKHRIKKKKNGLPIKKFLERLPSLHDIDLFSLNLDEKSNSDSDLSPFRPIRCKYHSPNSFINSNIS